MRMGSRLIVLFIMAIVAILIEASQAAPTIDNNKEFELQKITKTPAEEGKVEMIDIEPSDFALSDEEYDPDFDYGDEDSMLVKGKNPVE